MKKDEEFPTDEEFLKQHTPSIHNINLQSFTELCKRCKGFGYTNHSEVVNYHNYEERDYTEPCTVCDEQGLVTVTTMSMDEPMFAKSYTKTVPKYRVSKK